MEYQAFYQLFDKDKHPADDLYRTLYRQNPEAFENPVRNWEEFCIRCKDGTTGGNANFLPEMPPTRITGLFEENIMFPEEKTGEVKVVVNARYCPAFLHELEFIKLIYVFRGSCSFYIDDSRIEMTAGNSCIVAPGVEQAVFSCADEDIVLNLLIRRSTFAESFAGLLEINEGGIIADFFWKMLYHKPGGRVLLFHSKPHLLLEESVMELYEEAALQQVKSRLIMKSLMMSIFAYIMQWNEQSVVYPELRSMQKRYPLAQYLLFMKRHIVEVTLTGLAEEFRLSEGYLSRYFRKETGNTFSYILREMKMKRASELLLKTECSIEKIISLIGYTDKSVFFRNFKSTYGMTPVTYRKQNVRLY